MKSKRERFLGVICLVLLFFSAVLLTPLLANDATPRLVAGNKLDSLTIGATTYRNVVIRSVSARSVIITHTAGMASFLLRDLSPELQQRFGYSLDAEHAQETAAKIAAEQQQARMETRRENHITSQGVNKIDRLLRSLGQQPEIAGEVDLRPRFSELGLWVKDQGHRPSCAVFAIVSALEFQSAEATGNAERFSEEYLFWATCKALDRPAAADTPSAGEENDDQSDAGFSLQEVATALRAYGIPLRDKMPNQFSGKAENPPDAIIEEARHAGRISVHSLPGHDGATLATHIIHALNMGIPVPIGMQWPDTRMWGNTFLDNQSTTQNRGHAVTIIGYRSKTGGIEDAVFTFKNSWGPRWGQSGYGVVTYGYLKKNLRSAVVLEVQPEKPRQAQR